MPGWGTFFGTIADRFKSRKEKLLIERRNIQKTRDNLQEKWLTESPNGHDLTEYNRLGARLCEIEEELATFKA